MPPAPADGGAEKKPTSGAWTGMPLKTPPSRRARADGEERGGGTTGEAREETVVVSQMAVRRDIAGAEVRAVEAEALQTAVPALRGGHEVRRPRAHAREGPKSRYTNPQA